MSAHASPAKRSKRVLVFGATGTIGRATTAALIADGHDVTCFLRNRSRTPSNLSGALLRYGDVTDPVSVQQAAFGDIPFDAVISCLASRTGAPQDAWAIDHHATVNIIEAAKAAGTPQMVLLSAICVQKPRLAFQHAKLRAEAALIASGLTYSIVRPTAYFKSLAGQIARVQNGKPYLLFGDGELTACTPISDRDLGTYLAECLDTPDRWNQILPIGGPGPALTPRAMGQKLFDLSGQPPKFKHVPVGMMRTIAGALGVASRIVPPLSAKAEFARIGLYYATESMLAVNPDTGAYDRDATPIKGTDTLFDYYAAVLRGEAPVERGDHSVF
ncbi:NAD(P)H-binding protein [Tateyamaria omphalii]|uniref:Divinyl chlorophyllide a 8-vinyl-reductase, chloroplastic n=1 Tax=Tateyamaria omphalii TaxID=299262 RepID=A0A1P8MRV4_9RHOB|nr:NAD(P)H-binding protein [Tateyamaria omphalii]APX10778.1 epimerase [Tateyamaria omphalii]